MHGPVGQEQSGFRRDTGHHIQMGKLVRYALVGFPFHILISRDGIQIQGQTPIFGAQGVEAFIKVMRHAGIHHTHLASTPVGEAQTILDEDIVAEMSTTTDGDLRKLSSTVTTFNGARLVKK